MTTINPQEVSFAFRLGEYDCYRTKTGKCSLLLTEEEYIEAKHKEINTTEPTEEGRVDYCRAYSQHLVELDEFNHVEDTFGIRATQYRCGHVSFSDGQHRTCIAKQLGLNSIKLEGFDAVNDFDCMVCGKRNRETKNKSFLIRLLESIPIKNKVNPGRPFEFIDDEEYPR